MDILFWVIIGIVVIIILWRLVTTRYRVGRKMLQNMSDDELIKLDINMLRQQGLENIYKEELKRRGLLK